MGGAEEIDADTADEAAEAYAERFFNGSGEAPKELDVRVRPLLLDSVGPASAEAPQDFIVEPEYSVTFNAYAKPRGPFSEAPK